MKKYIAFLLCFLMCVSLISCEKEKLIVDGQATSADVSAGGSSSSPNNAEKDTLPPQNAEPTKRELAMQAYEAVVRNEVKLNYPLDYSSTGIKETYFEDIFYIGRNNTVVQALVDMDKDGVEEMVMKNYDTDKTVILHYENDIVYGYTFNSDAMHSIYNNGSFYWIYYRIESEYGVSRISFVNGRLKFEELGRVEQCSRFYLSGTQVSEEEYQRYMENITQTPIEFTTFNPFLISEEEAKAIASEYWGIKDGDFDSETGYRYKMIVYKDGDCYRVCLYCFVYNSHYDHLDCICVNGYTSETSAPEYPDAKG